MRWILLLLTLTAFAGCLDDDNPPAPVTEPETDDAPRSSGRIAIAPDGGLFMGTIANDHLTGDVGHVGHQIPELHTGGEGFQLLDRSTLGGLEDNLIGPSSGFIENHVVGDLMVVSSIFGSRGATLVDVSDPSDMRVLSHFYNLDDNWDARISEDGRFLFIGCQGSGAFDCTSIEVSGEQPAIGGGGLACSPVGDPTSTGAVPGCPGGIIVYDITTPSQPILEGYLPMGFTHNVYTYMRDGKHYFMNAAVSIAEWDPINNTMQHASANITGVHDIVVQQHPITGDWLLYTGGGGGSMTIWDVNDPFEPRLIASLEREEPVPSEEGDVMIPPSWHEQTPMPCLIEGRHITLGAGESGAGVPDYIAVLDTTDPTNPVYLGRWILPDHAGITGQNMYRFSLHNIDGNCDGQVAVGHYHAGVWVFDISTEARMKAPATLGYYLPHERPIEDILGWSPATGAPIAAVITADVPNVWSAQWSADGETLFIPDMTTGVYSLDPTWDYA